MWFIKLKRIRSALVSHYPIKKLTFGETKIKNITKNNKFKIENKTCEEWCLMLSPLIWRMLFFYCLKNAFPIVWRMLLSLFEKCFGHCLKNAFPNTQRMLCPPFKQCFAHHSNNAFTTTQRMLFLLFEKCFFLSFEECFSHSSKNAFSPSPEECFAHRGPEK